MTLFTVFVNSLIVIFRGLFLAGGGEIEEFDLHEMAFLICCLAVSQEMKLALPSWMSCFRSSSRSLCH